MLILLLKETINMLDVDVKEHERLPNIALRHKFKVKVQRYYFCSTSFCIENMYLFIEYM
jgi:hypothetical protein